MNNFGVSLCETLYIAAKPHINSAFCILNSAF